MLKRKIERLEQKMSNPVDIVEEDTIMTELKTQIATLENEISIMEMETEETVAIQEHKKGVIEAKLAKKEDKE